MTHHVIANIYGNNGNVTDFIFLGSKSLQILTTAMKLKDTCHLGEKKAKTVTNLDSIFKTKHYFANKGPSI